MPTPPMHLLDVECLSLFLNKLHSLLRPLHLSNGPTKPRLKIAQFFRAFRPRLVHLAQPLHLAQVQFRTPCGCNIGLLLLLQTCVVFLGLLDKVLLELLGRLSWRVSSEVRELECLIFDLC